MVAQSLYFHQNARAMPQAVFATEYKIVSESEMDSLILKVNDLLKQGWMLLGAATYADLLYMQTLIKYNQE